jgi:hypothetical protein
MYDQSFGPVTGLKRITPEFRAALKKETYWEQLQNRPTLDKEQSKAVGLGVLICPLCEGHREILLMHRGEVTGIEMQRRVECVCRGVRWFWTDFKYVDSRFRDADLDTLEPTDKVSTPFERQTEIHQMLRSHPDASVLFTGPSGGGKTHLMAALYRHAVMQSTMEQMAANDLCQAVFWTSTSVMLNQHVAWEVVSNKEETIDPRYVTEAKIQRAASHGWRPKLYLDELDKFAVTPFKPGRLYEIVNAVYKCGGQVCATMNKSSDDFALMLKDRDLADSITRRIGGDGGYTIPVCQKE